MEIVKPPFQAARSSNGIHHAMLSGECYRIYEVQNYALVDYFYSAVMQLYCGKTVGEYDSVAKAKWKFLVYNRKLINAN